MSGRVYARDALKAGFCKTGVQDKCRLLGVDFPTFRKEGVPIEQAEAIDDAQIARAVRVARARIQKERRDVG